MNKRACGSFIDRERDKQYAALRDAKPDGDSDLQLDEVVAAELEASLKRCEDMKPIPKTALQRCEAVSRFPERRLQ